jgi:hypothetical protein
VLDAALVVGNGGAGTITGNGSWERLPEPLWDRLREGLWERLPERLWEELSRIDLERR